MGIFDKLFGRASTAPSPPVGPTYSEADMRVIGEMAQRLVDVINESLKIAAASANPETRASRLAVAKQKLSEIKELASQYRFLTLQSLPEVELDIGILEQELEMSNFRAIAEANSCGEQLEKTGSIDEAIAHYEALVTKGTDTPFTYRRLAILYRKSKQRQKEVRVLKAALKNVPKSNAMHYAWFRQRLAKLN